MPFPDRLLIEDERVVLRLHPHWKTLTPAVFVLLAAVGVGSYAIAALHAPALRVLIAIAALALIVWFTGRRVVRWLTTHVVFTSERIIVRVGLLKRHRWELPLSEVTDVGYSSSILSRLLRCGTLIVRAAADEEGEGGQLTLVDLPRARDVQTVLYELMEEEEERALEDEEEEDEIPDSGNFRLRSPVVKLDQPD